MPHKRSWKRIAEEQHAPHCPVPRAAQRCEGATCICGYYTDKEDREKIAAVRKFRSSVVEASNTVQDSVEFRQDRANHIERRECCVLLKLLLNREPRVEEVDMALHLRSMD